MSNLLKQYYVTNAGNGMRVINSDERVQECLRKLNDGVPMPGQGEPEEPEASRMQEENPEEFSEGLEIQKVDVEAIRREAIESVRQEAERITAEAQAQAQQYLKDAQMQAQVMLAEQKQLGYEKGLAEAREQYRQKSDAMEEDIRMQRQEMTDNYQKKLAGMESDIVDAIIHVFDKVFQIQFEDKRDILLALVTNTLMDVDAGDKIRIHACERDYALLQEHESDIQEKVGPDVDVEFVHDNKLSEGQCQIETPFGVFDCGVDTELSGLLKDIRSLA